LIKTNVYCVQGVFTQDKFTRGEQLMQGEQLQS